MSLPVHFEELSLLKATHRFARKKKTRLYLVGGYLRDIFLKRRKENPDMDFCLKKDAIPFGRAFAKELKAGFVVLDKKNGSCRIVKKAKGRMYTLDFTDFRGRTLQEDLLHRDFTINALVVGLEDVIGDADFLGALIDPYGARRDLKEKRLCLVNSEGFDEDPLRILRAFSLACIFGLKIHGDTLRLIRKKQAQLTGVSAERIRDELFKILNQPDSFEYFAVMDRLGILKIILPEINLMRGVKQGPYHHLDVWRHSLETIRQIEILIQEQKRNKEVQDYLNEIISGERRRRALVKLGALLHDIGKPRAMRREDGKTKFHGHERIGMEITEGVARRLKLSNEEIEALKRMVFWHLRPGYLGDLEELSPRATFRYFRDARDESASILLLSLADQRSTKGPLTTEASRVQHEKICFRLIKEYFRRKKEKKMPRLVNGDELMKKFKLTPSPFIGKVLTELEELQAIGKIKTKFQGLEAARGIIRLYTQDKHAKAERRA